VRGFAVPLLIVELRNIKALIVKPAYLGLLKPCYVTACHFSGPFSEVTKASVAQL